MEEECAIFTAISILQLKKLAKMVTELRGNTAELYWEEHMHLAEGLTRRIHEVLREAS